MNDFYITLPSNTSPTNTIGKFSVHLPNKLSLDGQWEVALAEIQYPHSWNNIHGNTDKDNVIQVTFEDNLTVSVFVPSGYYGTIYELLAAIEFGKERTSLTIQRLLKKRKKILNKRQKKLLPRHMKDIKFGFIFEFDETLKRIRYKHFPSRVRSIKLSEKLQYMLGFKDPIITKSKQLAMYQTDLQSGFYSLFVYSNLVEPQIVGNVTAPLIRNVHIEGLHGDIIDKLFHTPHYVPVIAKEVDRIEIDIKDDNNQSVPFQFGKTVVKLHFRKKRYTL
ncbi:MAG: hypothetical protein GY795_07460 [Desulfobacterales bacterium]|nr:hypothetical protein [Desulfobacterales bacterium]